MSPIIKAVPLLHPCDASLAEKLHRIARLRSSNAKKCMKRLPGLDGVEGVTKVRLNEILCCNRHHFLSFLL